MTVRLFPALALAALLGTAARADDPKLPDAKTFDKLTIDALREVHNTGAELYNKKEDYPGAYRLYQGSLLAVRPLLTHRPEAQQIIDTALAAAVKETDPARKAFLLHECIEGVRKHLKIVNGFPLSVAPAAKPDGGSAPGPKDEKPNDPPAKGGSVNGNIRLKGAALTEGEVTFVSLDRPEPKVVSAAIKDGAYKFPQPVPAGNYAVILTGKGVPERYTVVTTSGLVVKVAAGANTLDFELK